MRWHHDVSTDPANPPPFVALRAERLACANGFFYSGLDPSEHRLYYADLHTTVYAHTPDEVFRIGVAAAHTLSWKIAAAAEIEGRIEATATTPLLRFKDDVVIRIREQDDGTTLDARSASRIGSSDLGANARRLRAFLRELNNRLKTNT